MQNKVMAVAVAAAFAAPSVALAQGSSVQIYGSLTMSLEGAQAKGADTNGPPLPGTGGSSIRGGNVGGGYVIDPNIANVNEPFRSRTQSAGSNIGFRGREDLGNGLYMGFQAEMEARVATSRPAGGTEFGTFVTWRNSGLWLGGRWGEFGIGLWDSPFTINTNTLSAAHSTYANASTSLAAGLLGIGFADSSVAGQDLGQFCGANFGQSATTTVNPTNCFRWATVFNRRVGNSVWYVSPNWAGFSARVQYGATSGATSNATNESPNLPSTVKPSLWSVGLNYALGGFFAGVGYEYHGDYITAAARSMGVAGLPTIVGRCAPGFDLGGNAVASVTNSATLACIPIGTATTNGISSDDSNAVNVNLRYTFGFGLSIGGYYEWIKWKMDYANNPGGTIATGDGNLTELKRNAYRLDAAYQLGAHTFGLQYARANNMRGTVSGNGFSFDGSSTAANGWVLGYAYSLSKRSSIYAYGTIVDNDTNARYTGASAAGIGPNAGGDPRYFGVGLRHLF
jgi:predicted porin